MLLAGQKVLSTFFYVKSCYDILNHDAGFFPLQPNLMLALDILWVYRVPLKVKVFGWRVLLNRLPTRSNLGDIGVISNSHDKACVFCFQAVEEADYVFLICPRTRMVWKWLGIGWEFVFQ